MFGNKGYRWKLAGALALIAGLGVSAGTRGDRINPSIWRCLAEPQRWDGARIWIPAARIAEVRDGDYDVESSAARIRVAGPAPSPAESRISMTAVFRAAGPSLEPLKTRPLPRGGSYRRLMEIVSVLVVLGVLANFARHFLFRPKVLQAEGGPR